MASHPLGAPQHMNPRTIEAFGIPIILGSLVLALIIAYAIVRAMARSANAKAVSPLGATNDAPVRQDQGPH